MREYHLQTPLKDLGNPRSKFSSDQTKKLLKTSKKTLNSVFESETAAFSESSPKESSIGSSLISSAVSDDYNILTEPAVEDFLLTPENSPSSEVVDQLPYLTPISSALTSDKPNECTGSNNSSTIPQSSDVKVGFIEAEMAVKYLREAQMQLVNATEVDIRYKKVLDAVIHTVAEEFCGLQEEKDWYDTLISKKLHLVSLTFLLWIIGVSIGLFLRSGETHSFHGPRPT